MYLPDARCLLRSRACQLWSECAWRTSRTSDSAPFDHGIAFTPQSAPRTHGPRSGPAMSAALSPSHVPVCYPDGQIRVHDVLDVRTCAVRHALPLARARLIPRWPGMRARRPGRPAALFTLPCLMLDFPPTRWSTFGTPAVYRALARARFLPHRPSTRARRPGRPAMLSTLLWRMVDTQATRKSPVSFIPRSRVCAFPPPLAKSGCTPS